MPFQPACSIAEVSDRLGSIAAWAVANDSRLGYFAALYKVVTDEVIAEVDQGNFKDGARLERLDVGFANLYFQALWNFLSGKGPVPGCWSLTFDAARRNDRLILQHVILGIHAHINHDLGIAAATIPSDPGFQEDFDYLNEILGRLLDRVEAVLGQHSPLLRIGDVLLLRSDEAILNFSLRRARDEAWHFSRYLAGCSPSEQVALLEQLDIRTRVLSRVLLDPPPPLSSAVDMVRWQEREDLPAVIQSLLGA